MTQNEIKELAILHMADNKANRNLIAEGWGFKIHNRASSIGMCCYNNKTIYFSSFYTELKPEDILDTILHEIAHALVGPGNGHNKKWRNMCIIVGAKPRRCNETKINENVEMKLAKSAKYIAVCPGCNKVSSAFKKMKRNRSCANCSGAVYNEKFRLNFKLNKGYIPKPKQVIVVTQPKKDFVFQIGFKFSYKGQKFEITGFNYRNPKNNIQLTNIVTGKKFKCSVQTLEKIAA